MRRLLVKVTVGAALAAATVVGTAGQASASHFRYMTVNWERVVQGVESEGDAAVARAKARLEGIRHISFPQR